MLRFTGFELESFFGSSKKEPMYASQFFGLLQLIKDQNNLEEEQRNKNSKNKGKFKSFGS
jgi:hypothetical protein